MTCNASRMPESVPQNVIEAGATYGSFRCFQTGLRRGVVRWLQGGTSQAVVVHNNNVHMLFCDAQRDE